MSVSCRGFRERTCISTSPAATIGRPVNCGDADDGVDEVVVAGAVQQLEGDRGAILEPGLQPHRVREDVLERLRRRRHEQRQALGQAGERRRVRHLAFDVAGMGEVASPSRHAGARP